jgi:PAT family beta-lactamase induction signal transducer AmpG
MQDAPGSSQNRRRLMPDLLATRWGRLTAFFFLYVTEGIPLGFTATAVATQMRRQGLTPGQIGAFVGLLYAPWAWKWVVAPVVDLLYSKRLGRRRGWIVIMQCLMVGGLLLSMNIDFTAELKLYTVIILLVNICGATQDVAIDALACTTLKESERGTANGLMFAGAYLGNALGGAGVLILSAEIGFANAGYLAIGSILVVTILVAIPLREPKSDDPLDDDDDSGDVHRAKAIAMRSPPMRFKSYRCSAVLAPRCLPAYWHCFRSARFRSRSRSVQIWPSSSA